MKPTHGDHGNHGNHPPPVPDPQANPARERRVWEGLLHPGEGDDLLVSTFWGTEALNLEHFLHRKVRITIEVLDEGPAE